jgi:hypothetical protein
MEPHSIGTYVDIGECAPSGPFIQALVNVHAVHSSDSFNRYRDALLIAVQRLLDNQAPPPRSAKPPGEVHHEIEA